MPNLSAKASHDYWRAYPDPIIYKVLCCMESAEKSKDKNTLIKIILQELGKTLDQTKNVDLSQLDQGETLITLANHLNMNQTLRLLQGLNTTRPGSAAQLLMHAEKTTRDKTDEANIFLQRNLIFERLRLLPRLFSKERLKLVYTALNAQA